jgi:hypothetical protein
MSFNRFDILYDTLLHDFLKSPKNPFVKEKYINLKQTDKDKNIEKLLTFFIKIYDYENCKIFCKCTKEDVILVIIISDHHCDRHIVLKRKRCEEGKIKPFENITAGFIINHDIVYLYEFSIDDTKAYLKFILN